jgi:hypothetical protein
MRLTSRNGEKRPKALMRAGLPGMLTGFTIKQRLISPQRPEPQHFGGPEQCARRKHSLTALASP